MLALVAAAISGGTIVWAAGRGTGQPVDEVAVKTSADKAQKKHPYLPREIRGIHVTMGLASLPGKLDQYIALKEDGLNTIALDIKDETGTVAFSSPKAPLVSEIGAAGNFFRPAEVARQVHEEEIYLIGRIAVFEDPVLSARRPDLAIQRSDGSRWLDYGGLGWTNQYDKRVWDYNVSIAKAAARAGFDEIQFDYIRFPSDGDVASAVWPGKRTETRSTTIADFLKFAKEELSPLGVRVSADVFGLAATEEQGLGQSVKLISRAVDAIYPMVYPSHFGAGQYSIPDPQAVPGTVVGQALGDFEEKMVGGKAELIPWLQDFSLGKKFGLNDVQDQVLAARRSNTRGFLLWNPNGTYTPGGLEPAESA